MTRGIGNCYLFVVVVVFNQLSYLIMAAVVQKPEALFEVNLFLQESCLPKLQFHSILEALWKQSQTPAGILWSG